MIKKGVITILNTKEWVYKRILIQLFECDEDTLEKIVNLILKSKKLFGTEIANSAIRDIVDSIKNGGIDFLKSTIYYVICAIVVSVLSKEPCDDFYDKLLEINYYGDNLREDCVKALKILDLENEVEKEIIRKFNVFLK